MVSESSSNGSGCANLTEDDKAVLAASKEANWEDVHIRGDFWVGAEAVKACRGASVAAIPGKNR